MKILIFDIGNFSIKTLVFEKKYRGYNLISFFNTNIIKESALSQYEQITETLKKLKSEQKLDCDQVLVVDSITKSTSRFLTLPFRDYKRLTSIIPVELEDELPFEMSDVLYEWMLIKYIDKKSYVFTNIINKFEFKLFRDSIVAAGFDPIKITTSSEVLFHLSKYIDKEETENSEKSYALIDFGANKTNLVVITNEEPSFQRTINYGGEYLTKKIMQEYSLTREEAEKSKKEVGCVLLDDAENATEEQKRFSSVLKEGLDVIIRDINQSLSHFRADKKTSIDRIFIAGAAWQIKNFKEYLEEELKIKVEKLTYYKKLGLELPFANKINETSFVNTMAMFLSYSGKSGLKGLNFCRGEFSSSKNIEGDFIKILKSFKPTIRNVALTLLILLLYLFIKSYFLLDPKVNNYKKQLEQKIELVFPEKGKKAQQILLSSFNRLEEEVKDRLKRQKAIMKGESINYNSFMVLKDISEVIPKNIKIDLTYFEASDGKLKMKGLVDKNSDIDLITKYISNNPRFMNIKREKPSDEKTFDISANYKEKN